MGSLGEAVLDLTADASKLDPGLNEGKGKVTGALDGLKSIFGEATGTMLGQLSASALRDVGRGIISVGKDITGAALDAEQAQAQLNAVLKSTQGVAGLTADEVNNLADSYSKLTMFDDEAIIGAESMLLTFTSISKDVFPEATKTVLDMSQALGQDLNASAMQLGKALNDPIQGVSALRRVGVQFTDDQEAMIKSLVDSGNAMEAQKMILAELNKEFGGSAEAAGQTMAGQLAILDNEFGNLKEDLGTSFLPVFKDLVGVAKELMPYLQQAVKWFSGLPTPVKTGVVAFLGLIAVLAPLIGVISSVASILTVIGPLFAGAGTAIAAAAGPILIIIGVLAALYLAWKTNFMGIQEGVKTFVQIFKHLWNAFLALLRGDTKTALNELGLAWQTYWTEAQRRLQSAGESIRNIWRTITDFLKSVWKAAWDAVVSYVMTKANEAINNVTSLVNGIKNVFNIDWSELGKRIIDGIVAGLMGGINAVIDAATAVAQGALDAAKSILGIQSPSKAFAEIGNFSGLGFVQGFQKTLTPQSVAGTLNRVVSGAAQTMNRSTTYNTHVYNPTPEPASKSMDKTLRRLSWGVDSS